MVCLLQNSWLSAPRSPHAPADRMQNPLRRWLPDTADDVPPPIETTMPPLADVRLVIGELLVAAGAGATIDALSVRGGRRRGGEEPDLFDPFPEMEGGRPVWSRIADWGALVAGPAAGAAQITHALYPSPANRTVARVLSAAAVAVGTATLADSFRASWEGERPPSLANLVFASAGILGLLVDRIEHRVEEAERALERAPRRPARRVEKIVIKA